MNLNAIRIHAPHFYVPRKILNIMKITTLLLLITVMTVSAATYAQKINLHEKKASLEQVLEKIRIQSGYDLIYSDIMLDKSIPVTINLKDATLDEALQASLEGQPLSYQIQDGTVVFRVKQPGILDKMKSALNLDKIDVRGMVIDENNQRLTGATVLVKGTGNVTTTDQFGLFILKGVDPNATIVITFIGYDKTELPATSDMGRIKLSIASSPLDEVKVIAYGQTTQRLSVGNVASVSAKDIEKQPVGNPLLALEGRVPGLFITPSNGLPGSGVTVRIQGQNSIVNGSDPLYVIDGVPYSSQTLATTIAGPLGRSSGGPGSGGGSNPMNFVNPSDIESISILKDADATSIYGSRAANGAILIITKKGKGGQTKVNFDIQNGIGQVSHFLDLMNTQQYLQMRHEALNNDGASITPFTYDLNGSWDTTRYTSWQKTLIGNTAHYANYNVSVSGGNDNTQYLVGSTFHRETSVFPGDFADQKGSLHFSLNTASSNQKFKMQLTGSYLFDDNQLPNTDLTATALGLAPDAPPLFKSDGTLNWQLNSSGTAIWSNPLAPTRYQTYQNKTYNLAWI